MKSTGSDRVVMVLNHADAEGALPAAMISKGLGREPDVRIPNLGKRMVQAVNLGAPAIDRVPALRGCLKPLIREVAGIGGKKRSSWFGRIFRK